MSQEPTRQAKSKNWLLLWEGGLLGPCLGIKGVSNWPRRRPCSCSQAKRASLFTNSLWWARVWACPLARSIVPKVIFPCDRLGAPGGHGQLGPEAAERVGIWLHHPASSTPVVGPLLGFKHPQSEPEEVNTGKGRCRALLP